MSGPSSRGAAPGGSGGDAPGWDAPGWDAPGGDASGGDASGPVGGGAPGPVGADGDGTVTNGTVTNGAVRNGTVRNVSARDGTVGNGTVENGTVENGTAGNGAGGTGARQTRTGRPSASRSRAVRTATGRDHQRARLYRAEDLVARMLDRSAEFPVVQVAGSSITLPIERKFGDIASAQRYVNAVLELPWVRQEWPLATTPVTVRERQGPARAHYERTGHTIALPLHRGTTAWALRELVVLHEIAHHFGEPIEEPHGPEFAARLLRLVDGIIGAEVAFLLRVSLLDVGVAIG